MLWANSSLIPGSAFNCSALAELISTSFDGGAFFVDFPDCACDWAVFALEVVCCVFVFAAFVLAAFVFPGAFVFCANDPQRTRRQLAPGRWLRAHRPVTWTKSLSFQIPPEISHPW